MIVIIKEIVNNYFLWKSKLKTNEHSCFKNICIITITFNINSIIIKVKSISFKSVEMAFVKIKNCLVQVEIPALVIKQMIR